MNCREIYKILSVKQILQYFRIIIPLTELEFCIEIFRMRKVRPIISFFHPFFSARGVNPLPIFIIIIPHSKNYVRLRQTSLQINTKPILPNSSYLFDVALKSI